MAQFATAEDLRAQAAGAEIETVTADLAELIAVLKRDPAIFAAWTQTGFQVTEAMLSGAITAALLAPVIVAAWNGQTGYDASNLTVGDLDGARISADLVATWNALTGFTAAALTTGLLPTARLDATPGTAGANDPAVLGTNRDLDFLRLLTLELGAATDTQLSRAAAGVVKSTGTYAGDVTTDASSPLSHGGNLVVRSGASGASVAIDAGTADGQLLIVLNTSGGAITSFDASSVRDGGTITLAVDRGLLFVWDAATSRWWACTP